MDTNTPKHNTQRALDRLWMSASRETKHTLTGLCGKTGVNTCNLNDTERFWAIAALRTHCDDGFSLEDARHIWDTSWPPVMMQKDVFLGRCVFVTHHLGTDGVFDDNRLHIEVSQSSQNNHTAFLAVRKPIRFCEENLQNEQIVAKVLGNGTWICFPDEHAWLFHHLDRLVEQSTAKHRDTK